MTATHTPPPPGNGLVIVVIVTNNSLTGIAWSPGDGGGKEAHYGQVEGYKDGRKGRRYPAIQLTDKQGLQNESTARL